MRIIFVPQYPAKTRYQEFWYSQFPIEFKKRGFEVLVLGKNYVETTVNMYQQFKENFSPVNQAIEFETYQMNEYMSLKLRDDDILFLADISFPGLFCNILHHKQCSKMFAFCHATSLNTFDYFMDVRNSKSLTEWSHSFLFNKIFLGSKYHQDKLSSSWINTMVTYLPFPDFGFKITGKSKTIDIISVSRPTKQKVDLVLENQIEKDLNIKIQRPISNTWVKYYWNLSSAKILLISAAEDTFGYQIVDAVLNNCIPIARNSLAYPEILPREYLYDTREELVEKINSVLSGKLNTVPRLLCEEQMNKFYDTICEEMKNAL